MDATTIEHRLARLEAIEEIRNLRHRYARICDTGREAERLRTVFTEDAVWDGGERFGVHRGIDAILAHAAASQQRFVWNVHYLAAPTIEVDDDLEGASGTWYLWEPCNVAAHDGTRAAVVIGSYMDRYRRLGDEWRIAAVRLSTIAMAPQGSWEVA